MKSSIQAAGAHLVLVPVLTMLGIVAFIRVVAGTTSDVL